MFDLLKFKTVSRLYQHANVLTGLLILTIVSTAMGVMVGVETGRWAMLFFPAVTSIMFTIVLFSASLKNIVKTIIGWVLLAVTVMVVASGSMSAGFGEQGTLVSNMWVLSILVVFAGCVAINKIMFSPQSTVLTAGVNSVVQPIMVTLSTIFVPDGSSVDNTVTFILWSIVACTTIVVASTVVLTMMLNRVATWETISKKVVAPNWVEDNSSVGNITSILDNVAGGNKSAKTSGENAVSYGVFVANKHKNFFVVSPNNVFLVTPVRGQLWEKNMGAPLWRNSGLPQWWFNLIVHSIMVRYSGVLNIPRVPVTPILVYETVSVDGDNYKKLKRPVKHTLKTMNMDIIVTPTQHLGDIINGKTVNHIDVVPIPLTPKQENHAKKFISGLNHSSRDVNKRKNQKKTTKSSNNTTKTIESNQ